MAELVEQSLEELLPVFEQLIRVELFTEKEIKEIIRRCRSFEYRLQKQVKRSADFERYAEYVSLVAALVTERRRAANYWFKRAEIDSALYSKADSLLRRACLRWQGQLHLWRARLRFNKRCRRRHTVSRVYQRALQVHGADVSLWLEAARWEASHAGSVQNCRTLLHRALRIHPADAALWLELCRSELRFVQKLRERRELLEEEKRKGADADGNDDAKPAADAETSADDDAVLSLQLARVAADGAASARPMDVELRLAVWRAVAEFDFAADLAERLFADTERDFPSSPLVCRARVLRCEDDARAAARSVDETAADVEEVFRDALDHFPSEAMWREYLTYCLKRSDDDRWHRAAIAAFEGMHTSAYLAEDDYCRWIGLIGDSDAAQPVVERALERFPKSASVWCEALQVKMLDGRTPAKQVRRLFNRAIREVSESEAEPLWRRAVDWTLATEPQRLATVLDASLTWPPAVAARTKVLALEWTALNGSSAELRALFGRLAATAPNDAGFYRKYVQLERLGATPDAAAVGTAYELAVGELGATDARLWLDYLHFCAETDCADPSVVYRRALRCLRGAHNELFVQQAALRLAGASSTASDTA